MEKHDLDIFCLVYNPRVKTVKDIMPRFFYLNNGDRVDLVDAVYKLDPKHLESSAVRKGHMPPRRWVAIYSRRPPPEELTEEFGKPVITLHRNNAIGVVSCTYRCYGRDGTSEDRTQVLFDPRTTKLFMFRPVALWANSGQLWKLQAPLCALNTPHDNLPKLSASERRKLAIKETLKGLQAAQEVVKAKVALKKAALAAKSRDADSAPHTFDVGDRAWLAIPLDGEAQRLGAPKKFIFRWVGPVRIISQSGGDSESSFTVVETFPGGEITTREVHVGRLRPFTPRKPIDSAEAAVINSHPSFEEELETWKNKALLLTRRPVHSHQPLYTTDPLLRKKLDPDYDPEDEVNPLYEIEKMVSVWREQNMFWYLVKFRNQPVRENRVFNDLLCLRRQRESSGKNRRNTMVNSIGNIGSGLRAETKGMNLCQGMLIPKTLHWLIQ
ncbi:hypothetical protein BDR26DRAFT_901672 [Obelidium mucronatum]|nr:hypothetical protein BDR26DRAFT_901672 [Obelidium mucronatum]